jgi:hypothetical protein
MLELSSNTIKVLGIFGRLSPEQEAYFNGLEQRYAQRPNTDEYAIYRHFSLTFIQNATIGDVREQIDLLKELKQFLPFKLTVNKFFIKEEESSPGAEDIAIEFGLEQTKEIVEFVRSKIGDRVVATPYIKVVWFVPKENQQTVIDELTNFKELEFTDFYLVSNKQDEANTIYTSNSL